MRKEKIKYPYILTVIVCISFLVFGAVFIHYMMVQNEKEDIEYLHVAAEQKKIAVTRQMKGNWETLNGVAICIGDMDVIDTHDLIPILKDINDKNMFIRMGFITPDGMTDLIDLDGNVYGETDLSSMDFFKRSLKGENTISDIEKDLFSDTYINYYGVPVKNNGEIIGVLCAVDDANVLKDIINIPIFNNKGTSNLVKSNGDSLFYSGESGKGNGENVFSEIEKVKEGRKESVIQALEENQEISFQYSQNGEDIWGIFFPIQMNDWFLFSTVQKVALNSNYNTILGVVAIIGAALIIFIFFVYRMNRMDEKNKKQLEYLAYTDTLTGHANYAKFLMDAQELIGQETDKAYALWHCNIKRFKFFNDIFGYRMGDKVLKYFTSLLEKHSKKNELFCRVNADNFVGISCYSDKNEVVEWFHALEGQMGHYELSDKKEYPVELNIGIYCADEFKETLTINEMINRANMARKSAGKLKDSNCIFYSDSIRRDVIIETDMETHMRQSLKDGEFEIYIQPKVDIQKGNIIAGGEVLARWNSKEKGMIVPAKFIPLFEKNGFIIQLDRYMFEGICRWLRQYIDEGNRELRIATNVSRLGLFQEDFLDFYVGIKNKYRIPDGMLELEFTESVVLDGDEFFENMVIELQKKGFICSLDDFGSGYSSLNILKDLPIQVLKLDMLFFQKGIITEKEGIIIRNIVTMAKQLKINTVSEGVELPSQVSFLKEIGCDIVQGYVFAKPMPLSEFKKMLIKYPDGISLTGDMG